MRLGTCLLFDGLTLQGANHKLADFYSAPLAGFCAAVDTDTHVFFKLFLMRYCVQEQCDNDELDVSYLRQALSQVSF